MAIVFLQLHFLDGLREASCAPELLVMRAMSGFLKLGFVHLN